MEIPTPHVGKPVKPADAVLTEVLNSISPGFDLSENLMEQGLTSFNAMQIVTRCAEQGFYYFSCLPRREHIIVRQPQLYVFLHK
jgi:hypothetical protein